MDEEERIVMDDFGGAYEYEIPRIEITIGARHTSANNAFVERAKRYGRVK